MTTTLAHIVAAKWFHHGIVAVIILAGVVAGLETSPVIMAQYGGLLLAADKFILGMFGTMIILSLFIGIIMNSMSEMHAEIAERDRAQQERETGSATVEDELNLLELEMKKRQTRVAGLPRKWIGDTRQRASARHSEENAA